MSYVTFENYARLACSALGTTEKAGRYAIQTEAEQRIPLDVATKLDLQVTDHLLDIGCGLGNILLPLSGMVARAAGLDHPAILAELRKRSGAQPLELIEGNFLDIGIDKHFHKVLVYSVLHCLTDTDEAARFAEKAMALVASGGRLLLGDIPNVDRKARFLSSREGKLFQDRWEASLTDSRSRDAGTRPSLPKDSRMATFNDRTILDLVGRFRALGHEAYVLPQPQDLPFGRTREDVLIIRASG